MATPNGGTIGDAKGFQPMAGASFFIPVATEGESGVDLSRGFDLFTSIYFVT